ncbi:hypothetical protein V1L52_07630 [Treponema sp. HNW]|uniref:hypothetical protein n=1 Tax=Treponema sp. HNW TaxID=3116654 RepID=UPI003D0A9F59
MTKKQCPVCGGVHLKCSFVKKAIGDNEFSLVNYVCDDCGEEGDFFNENDKELSKALVQKHLEESLEILSRLERQKRNFAGIERALNIPQRTFSKWKNKKTKPSAPAIALLKFLDVFPWLIDVADNKFDKIAADNILLKHVCSLVKKPGIDRRIIYYNDESQKGIAVSFFHTTTRPGAQRYINEK